MPRCSSNLAAEPGLWRNQKSKSSNRCFTPVTSRIAAWEPDTGYADGPSTVYGFAQAAIHGGARIFEQTEARKINVTGGKVIGVETSKGHIATPAIVVAAGGFALPLFRPLGIELDLYPRRIQVAVFRWPFQMDQHRPHRVVIDSINRSWMRSDGMAGTLIGVESRSGVAVDPVNFDETVEAEYVDQARQALAARFPVFDGALMRGSWSGVVMQSPDDHPIIDQIPDIGGLYVSTGDSGSSFKTGPAVGIVFAEWITSGEPQLMDMSPFRASRFAEGIPWKDAHGYTTGSGHSVSR